MAKSPSALTVEEILSRLEERAPASTAESWDNVGLLVGDPAWKTARAIVSVDLSVEALETAQKQGTDKIRYADIASA